MSASMARMTFCNLMKLCSSCANIQMRQALLLRHPASTSIVSQSREKHYDMKWRKLRAAKVLKIDLPDFQKIKKEGSMSPEERRSYMKREKMAPPRQFQERDLLITSTSQVFDPYVPPEGDGKASIISGEKVKQLATGIEKKSKSFIHVKKIKAYEEFDSSQFAEQALDIYREAHELLMNTKNNEDRLHQLVTEKAYPDMVWLLEKKTFRWEFIGSLESPRVVHVRVESMLDKDNKYAQVTVRFHTQQTLALYDRFGRLYYGNEHVVKDILEYVVFEKYLSDENSQWRIHSKLTPDWMERPHTILKTLRVPDFEPLEEEEEAKGEEKSVSPQNEQTVTAAV